jgi:hypothetical protein
MLRLTARFSSCLALILLTMESNTSIPRRRPSHVRENYAVGPDRPFLIKRNRGKSREQTRLLSDDDNTPMARGDNRRRKKKIFSSSPNIPSTSGHHPGPSTDASHAIVERTHKSHKYKHDVSRTFPDPTSLARTASREGRRPSTKASSVAAASDDDAGLQANQSGPIATMEFSRMKRELETLKKVCLFLFQSQLWPTHCTYPASNSPKENDRKASKCGLPCLTFHFLSDVGVRLLCLWRKTCVQCTRFVTFTVTPQNNF